MKYLKKFRIFESKEEIEFLCQKYGIQNYTINDDGTVDVYGHVKLTSKGLNKI